MHDVIQIILTFLLMGAFCTLLERLWPHDPGAPAWRSDSFTDVLYFLLRIGLSLALALATAVAGRSLPAREPLPAGSLPFVVQLLAVLFLSDFIQYWAHLVMHQFKPLWHVHAVHHSPEEIDWLVAARVHPFELGFNKILSAVPLYFIGFTPEVIAAAVPLVAAYSLLLHSNLAWTYGPLGYILASPEFHRWHHSSDPLARDKNYAQLFSCIDFLFGTAYFPRELVPKHYGLVSGHMPSGIWGQFVYPILQWLRPGSSVPSNTTSMLSPIIPDRLESLDQLTLGEIAHVAHRDESRKTPSETCRHAR